MKRHQGLRALGAKGLHFTLYRDPSKRCRHSTSRSWKRRAKAAFSCSRPKMWDCSEESWWNISMGLAMEGVPEIKMAR